MDANILSKIVDATVELVKCVNINVSEDGWHAQAMGGSHLAFFSFILNKHSFATLRVARPVTLGIKISALQSVMKIMKSVGTVHLKLSGNVLNIMGKHKGKSMRYELKLIDLQTEQLNIPDMDFEYIAHLPSSEFVCTCQTVFGETVCIQIGLEMVFTSKGKDGNSHVKYTDVVVKSSGELTLEFASRYLVLFSKGALLSKMVSLYMSPDMPIRIEFSFDGGHVCYYLAPKVED